MSISVPNGGFAVSDRRERGGSQGESTVPFGVELVNDGRLANRAAACHEKKCALIF